MMNNLHSTYIAFDAIGVKDPVNSNQHTFKQLADWQRIYPNRFDFMNLDDIDFNINHDELLETRLKTYFIKKLSRADNLLVVASPVVNVDSPILNWQISRAANRFRLPIIVAYAGLDHVDDKTILDYWAWLPQKVKKYIARDSYHMAHIPLTQDKLERALKTYSLEEKTYPWASTTIF